MGRFLLCLLLILAIASSSAAVPINYFFDTGSAHVTATRTSDNSLVVDTTLSLDGLFVTFDPASITLDDFEITAPISAAISMLQLWGDFDTFVVESASITPGGGYTSLSGGGSSPTFNFLVGPIDVAGIYGASYTGNLPPPPVIPAPVSNVPVPFVGSSFMNGTINTDTLVLELLGITLAHVPGVTFGETDDLIIKADITWSGTVPEPSTVALVGFGLILMSRKRRKGNLSDA